jgi:hypothetical protein
MHTESPPILHTVDMTWPDFCQRYQAAHPTRDTLFAKAEKEFRQHCNPTSLAHVTEGMFTRFAAVLANRGVAPDEARRRFSYLRRGLKWGFDAGLISPHQFHVERRGDAWVWKSVRKWHTGLVQGAVA